MKKEKSTLNLVDSFMVQYKTSYEKYKKSAFSVVNLENIQEMCKKFNEFCESISKSITISDSTGFLGIENFSGVFEGNGYSILNTDGPFVINLTGEINNVTFDSPKQFTASTSEDIKQLGITGNRYSFLLKQERKTVMIAFGKL